MSAENRGNLQFSSDSCLIYKGSQKNNLFIPDINECDREEGSECHENARCENTDGSFQCVCDDGYYGTGIECFGKIKILPSIVCS